MLQVPALLSPALSFLKCGEKTEIKIFCEQSPVTCTLDINPLNNYLEDISDHQCIREAGGQGELFQAILHITFIILTVFFRI